MRAFKKSITNQAKEELMLEVIIIHHLDGLFGPNILTSSQLAC